MRWKTLNYFILLFLLTPCILRAEFAHRMPIEAISSYEGMPSIIVNGVNVISGDYTLSETDINLHTPVPLTYTRFYNSLMIGPEPYFDLWSHNHECPLLVLENFRNRIDFVLGEHSGGSRLYFENNGYSVAAGTQGYPHINCNFFVRHQQKQLPGNYQSLWV